MTTPVRKRKAESDPPRRPRKKAYVTVERDDLTGRDIQYMQMTRGVRPPPRYLLPTNAQVRAQMNRTGGLDMELKFLDVQEVGKVFTNNTWDLANLDPSTPQCLNAVAMGDGASSRDGKMYSIKSIHIRGHVVVLPVEGVVDPTADVLVRLALVLDKQTNAAILNPTTVFTGNNGDAINGFRNLEYVQRYRVIEDVTFRIENNCVGIAANTYSAGGRTVPFVMNHEFKNPIRVNCTGTGSTVASINDNSLHLIGTAATDAATLALTRLNYHSRTRFHK